ncbi:MAG: hypothetical protein HXX08_11135 [Chloroflexi bacterium]|uniref:Uncharacterized protein n=1 Tax=Candidatus Chlorohelix allophototropha TaxID=3003348 RepID=A0A8T7M0T5_9CHLR|nr:hypothetical protein [Chloroflexota bacterium]WJW65790.1 hypothetical protein OZ401_001569 [Chloroflexota bacterium L227-S17]
MVQPRNFADDAAMHYRKIKRIIEHLRLQGCKVTDYSHIRDYQRRGIDLEVDGQDVLVICDQQISKTLNLSLELIEDFEQGIVGAFIRTQAKYLYYFDTFTQTLHILDIEKLKKVITFLDYKRMDAAKATTRGKDGRTYSSLNLLLPLTVLQSNKAAISYRVVSIQKGEEQPDTGMQDIFSISQE